MRPAESEQTLVRKRKITNGNDTAHCLADGCRECRSLHAEGENADQKSVKHHVGASRNERYGKTELRLVAVGGRVIIVDVDALMALDPLPREERLASVALFDNCLYFTSTLDGGSGLLRYESGVGVEREASFDEDYVGVYGNGEAVEAYAAKKTDSKKYIAVLVRTGDPLMTFEK